MDVIITSEDNVCFQGADGSATAFGFGGCGQNNWKIGKPKQKLENQSFSNFCLGFPIIFE